VQYLAYIDQIRENNLELAAEYLLMAALLIEIKSRMLLPRPQGRQRRGRGRPARGAGAPAARVRADEARGPADRRAAAHRPRLCARGGGHRADDRSSRFPEVNVVELREAWAEVLKRASLHAHHRIAREELSVREHMSFILRRLQGARFVEFADLFDPARGAPVAIVNFLALLELAREALIDITQATPYAPIYVRLAYTPS
jgi:segregation and condensation protein A